jgi:hypothetical protein
MTPDNELRKSLTGIGYPWPTVKRVSREYRGLPESRGLQ